MLGNTGSGEMTGSGGSVGVKGVRGNDGGGGSTGVRECVCVYACES